MSHTGTSSYGSDDEPVRSLIDVGRRKNMKSVRSHIVNPNFMFFCQIVLLIVPMAILFAGLYFTNVSSKAVVISCGAIIFAILCIFLFVRPFKEEKCGEKTYLRQDCQYKPVMHSGPLSTMPRREKRQNIHSSDDDNNDEKECKTVVHGSTDTLLSIESSNHSSNTGTEGITIMRSNKEQVSPKNTASLEDKSLMGVNLKDNGSARDALVDREDATDNSQAFCGTPCSSGTTRAENRMLQRLALTDSGNPSIQHSNTFSNPSTDNTRALKPTHIANRIEDQSAKDRPDGNQSTQRLKKGYQGIQETILECKNFSTNQNDNDDIASRPVQTAFGNSRIKTACSHNEEDRPQSTGTSCSVSNKSHRYTSTNEEHNKDLDNSEPERDVASDQPNTSCAVKSCQTKEHYRIDPSGTSRKNNYTPPATRKEFFQDSETDHPLVVRGNRNIFQCDTQKGSRNSRREFQSVTFQLCPSENPGSKAISPIDQGSNKQPILLKLFPTTSRDGMFLWESNPGRLGETKNPSHPSSSPCSAAQPRATDESVQTTAPEMVDTQTSMVPTVKPRIQWGSIKSIGESTNGSVDARHTIPGSIVDFVLRPFSKDVRPLVRTREKGNQRNAETSGSKQSKSRHRALFDRFEPDKTNLGSSTFDNLRHQDSSKKIPQPPKVGRDNKPISPKNAKQLEQTLKDPKHDICSIYYSRIHGKLYQPTKSGLLATESSKEEVDKGGQPGNIIVPNNFKGNEQQRRKTKSPVPQETHQQLQSDIQGQEIDGDLRTTIGSACSKRKSNDGRRMLHADVGDKKRKTINETRSPCREKTEHERVLNRLNSKSSDKLTIINPRFHLDISSESVVQCQPVPEKLVYNYQTSGIRESDKRHSSSRKYELMPKDGKMSHPKGPSNGAMMNEVVGASTFRKFKLKKSGGSP